VKRLIAVLGLLAMATHGHAHEVRSTVQTGAVTIVSLTYANGKPFAFEQFEVMPAGAQTPSQVGRTDAQGRAAILPVAGKALEFTVSAKDGHGARLALGDKTAPAPATAETPRWMLLAAGGGIIFGLFGLIQLFTTRKRKSPP